MKDPDGVSGQAVQMAKVRTRGEPKAAAGGRVLHVYPPTWRAAKQEPNFTGLMAAYAGAGTGDWNVVYQNKVGPGDIILVHAGLYKGDRHNYVDPLSTTFDGAYLLTAKGTPDRPIVIRAAGDGEVIFDGDGAFRLFDVMAADYHIFEGLTIRNTEVAFWAGVKDVAGSKGLTVRNCRIENVGVGVTTQFAGRRTTTSPTTSSSAAMTVTACSAGRILDCTAPTRSTATTRSRCMAQGMSSRTMPSPFFTTGSACAPTASRSRSRT